MAVYDKRQLMEEKEINHALQRMASEILERNKGSTNLLIMGIQRRGVDLAAMIADACRRLTGEKIPKGELDISLYRDDLSTLADQPILRGTWAPVEVSGRTVILVDDVIFTGRTARAAMDALYDLGRPSRVCLAVLVDRGHRELPIQPDFLGKFIPTGLNESISVKTLGWDGENSVWLSEHQS